MASELSLFLSLFNNLSVFIVLIAGYGYLTGYLESYSRQRRQLALGLFFGLVTIVSMHVKIPVADGVIVDQRNAIIALSGMFGGPLATLVSVPMAAAFRAYLGGVGVLGGTIGICLAAIAGLMAHRFRARIDSIQKRVVVTLCMVVLILPGFLVVGDLGAGWELLKRVALPYGAAIFIGILLSSLLMAREDKRRVDENSAQETASRLAAHVENTPLGIIEWDTDFRVTHWNRAAEEIFGYSSEEAIGRHAHDLIVTSATRTEIDQLWHQLLARKGGTRSINANNTKQGAVRICDWYNTLLLNSKGAVIGVASLVNDVTEQKQLEEEFRLFRYTIENSADAVFWINTEGGFDYVNLQACNSLGYTAEELMQLHTWDINADFTKARMDEIRQWFKENPSQPFQIEILHKRKDGTTFPIDVVSKLFMFGKKEVVVAFTRDISARKAVELELITLRNYLFNIINSMPSAIVGVDIDGMVTQWNKTAEKCTGVEAADAQGRPLASVLPWMASEMEKITESIRSRQVIEDLKKARPQGDGLHYEDITIYPLITNGVMGAVIRIDDVTEQVRLEEIMIQSEKMLSVGGLAAGMAHEINNPLAGMIQTASVLANRLGDATHIEANVRAAEAAGTDMETIRRFMELRNVPRMLNTLRESGKRISVIIDNMLSFARKSGESTSSHNLNEVLERTLDLASTDYDLKKQYDFKQIRINREYAEDLALVPCEAAKIQQVLLNILRNGAQAMQQAGAQDPQFNLRTYNNEARDMACVEIADNGPGMDEETRKRVFEPFFTTKPVGVGTGLGLSVSYFIVTENHSGKLTVDSLPGQGATFTICLPLDRS